MSAYRNILRVLVEEGYCIDLASSEAAVCASDAPNHQTFDDLNDPTLAVSSHQTLSSDSGSGIRNDVARHSKLGNRTCKPSSAKRTNRGSRMLAPSQLTLFCLAPDKIVAFCGDVAILAITLYWAIAEALI